MTAAEQSISSRIVVISLGICQKILTENLNRAALPQGLFPDF
jgi:hypothetical protein